MIGVEEALNIVLDNCSDFGSEHIPFQKSLGRVLDQNIYSDRPLPPFDRVSMDGIAINFAAYLNRIRTFKNENISPAGSPRVTLLDGNACVEVMTGAPLPIGTDTVIRYEDLEKNSDSFTINSEIKLGQNVHNEGSDRTLNEVLLEAGKKIGAPEIGVLATTGNNSIKVKKLPSIALVSSGEELVEVDKIPLPHQIRKSNIYLIEARLGELKITPSFYHLPDNEENILQQLTKIISDHDVIIMSGGVSKGKFDFIPGALDQLSFKKLFHRIKQRPGKPFWFGRKEQKFVFAFPGNPVSTTICFHKYFIPWLTKTIGLEQPYRMTAVLREEVNFKPDLTYFVQVKIGYGSDGIISAEAIEGNGSGDLANLSLVDGFLELPIGKNVYHAGESHTFIPIRRLMP